MRIDVNAELRRDPVDCKRGAPLGRSDTIGRETAPRLHVQRVRLHGGDYSPDGTYWGGTKALTMYCALSETRRTRLFVWAANRREARAEIQRRAPDAVFAERIRCWHEHGTRGGVCEDCGRET